MSSQPSGGRWLWIWSQSRLHSKTLFQVKQDQSWETSLEISNQWADEEGNGFQDPLRSTATAANFSSPHVRTWPLPTWLKKNDGGVNIMVSSFSCSLTKAWWLPLAKSNLISEVKDPWQNKWIPGEHEAIIQPTEDVENRGCALEKRKSFLL